MDRLDIPFLIIYYKKRRKECPFVPFWKVEFDTYFFSQKWTVLVSFLKSRVWHLFERERKKWTVLVFFFLKSRVWSLFEREIKKCRKVGPVCPQCPDPGFYGSFLDMAVSLCPSKDVQYVHTRKKKTGYGRRGRTEPTFWHFFLSNKWAVLVFSFWKGEVYEDLRKEEISVKRVVQCVHEVHTFLYKRVK